MLLAIDVGNTNIVLGIFDGDTLVDSWRLTTLRERTADEMGVLVTHLFRESGVEAGGIRGAILASVVPPLTGQIVLMVRRYLGIEPLTVEPGDSTGMQVLYDSPADVGADRVVNGLAAYELYGRAQQVPVIVVDFGTATTFDVISATGAYAGGVICPGIQISADALFQRAARLPRVDIRKPTTLVGTNTVASMQSGLFYGYAAMVEGLVTRMKREIVQDGASAVVCVATGGLAPLIAPETHVIQEVHLDLTLQGLRLVWERHQDQTRT